MQPAVSDGAAKGKLQKITGMRREVRDLLLHFKVCSPPAEDYKQQYLFQLPSEKPPGVLTQKRSFNFEPTNYEHSKIRNQNRSNNCQLFTFFTSLKFRNWLVLAASGMVSLINTKSILRYGNS